MKNNFLKIIIGFMILCSILIVAQITFNNPNSTNFITNNPNLILNASLNENNLTSLILNFNSANVSVYDSSLVLMYNFDNNTNLLENNSFIYDSSANSNNGFNNATSWTSQGRFGGGFSFNGSGSYIESNKIININGTSARTIAFWIKPADISGMHAIIGFGNNSFGSQFNAYINNGKWWFWGYGSGYDWDTNVAVDNNIWSYCTITFNGTNLTWYVNGVVIASNSTIQRNTKSEILEIGRAYDTNSYKYYFNGTLDEIRVWNKSLNSNEVVNMYNSNLQRNNLSNWNLVFNRTNLIDGNYSYQAFTTNITGDLNSSAIRTLTIDTVAPSLTIISPQNTSYDINEIIMNISSTNFSNIWWNNGSVNISFVNTTNYNFSNGAHTLIAYANDSAGNLNQTAVNFIVDTIYPTMTNMTDNNGTLYGTGIAEFNFSVLNTNGSAFIEINGVNYSAVNISMNNFNVNVSLGPGTYHYYIGSYGNGLANRYNISETRFYTVKDQIVSSGPATGGSSNPGGSFGSSSGTSVQKDHSITVKETELSDGSSFVLDNNDLLKFNIYDKENIILIKSINKDNVEFVLPDKENVMMIGGESRIINIDGLDIYLKVNSINDGKVEVVIKKLTAIKKTFIKEQLNNIEEIKDKVVQQITKNTTELANTNGFDFMLVVVIITLILVIVYIVKAISEKKNSR